MSWIATIKGDVDHQVEGVRRELEERVRDALAAVVSTLVIGGHQGVAGTFHFSKGGPSNLADTSAPPDAMSQSGAVGQVPVSTVPADMHTESVPYGTSRV